ncbi:MAG: hypothetical protein GC164_16485 [Phycisphaera sp.]|nr:hypothetical protein [Phycisphaera sp.]
MVALFEKMARYAADPLKRKGELLIERGIGYWVTPEGEFVPTPPRVSHADLVRKLIETDALDEDEADQFISDANSFAIRKGWTRVRVYPTERVVYVDLGTGNGSSHLKLVTTLLDQIGLPGLTIKYTDEEGNYVSP